LPATAAEDVQDSDGLLSVPKIRHVRKTPSSAFSTGLVQRVGKRLRRRATFGGAGDGSLLESGVGSSLRDEARFDTDAKRLSSGEVLGAVDAEDDEGSAAGASTSSSSFMRTGADGDPPTLRLREL
jgi:hypothetical protein